MTGGPAIGLDQLGVYNEGEVLTPFEGVAVHVDMNLDANGEEGSPYYCQLPQNMLQSLDESYSSQPHAFDAEILYVSTLFTVRSG